MQSDADGAKDEGEGSPFALDAVEKSRRRIEVGSERKEEESRSTLEGVAVDERSCWISSFLVFSGVRMSSAPGSRMMWLEVKRRGRARGQFCFRVVSESASSRLGDLESLARVPLPLPAFLQLLGLRGPKKFAKCLSGARVDR